jgi:hypothetical protein
MVFTANNANIGNFDLFPETKLGTGTGNWNLASGKGIIVSRVKDQANAGIDGATVQALSGNHPSTPYPICYDNACTAGLTSTQSGSNGAFSVRNVDDGDTVIVTASRNGYVFNTRIFHTYPGSVHEGAVTGANNLLQNGSFAGNLNGWVVNPVLQTGTTPWTPLLQDGSGVTLHPVSYSFMGPILYQNLNLTGIAGKTFNLSLNLTNVFMMSMGQTVAVYLTYVDGSGNLQRIKVLNPANADISNGTLVTADFVVPAGAEKIVKIELVKEDYGEFHGDNVVLWADGVTVGTTPNITGLSSASGAYGSTLTITGTNFGGAQGIVRIGGQAVTAATWTDTSITVNIQSPARSGNVMVIAGQVESNLSQTFQVMSPYFTVDLLNPGMKVIRGQAAEFLLKSSYFNGYTGNVGLRIQETGTPYLTGKWSFTPMPIRGNGGAVLKIDTANLGAGTYTANVLSDGGVTLGTLILKVVTVSDIKFYEWVGAPPATKSYLTSKSVANQGMLGVQCEVIGSDGQTMDSGTAGVVLQSGSAVLKVFKRPFGYEPYAAANGTTNLTATAPDGFIKNLPVTVSIPGGNQLVSSISIMPGEIADNYTGDIVFFAEGNNAPLGSIGCGSEGMPNFDTSFFTNLQRPGNTAGSTFKLTKTSDLGTALFNAQSADGSAKAVVPLNIVNDPATGLLTCAIKPIDVSGQMDMFTLAFYNPTTGVFLFERNISAMHMTGPVPVGNIPPGSYKILFTPANISVQPQWWPNATTIADAQAVGPFVAGGTVTGVTFFAMSQPTGGAGVALVTSSQTFNSSVPVMGGVGVTAGPGVSWSAFSNAPWITITSGVTGSGGGAVNFSVTANTSADPRTGTITIAGQTFTVTQAGTGQLPPHVGTWGVQVLAHVDSGPRSPWYAWAQKITFNADGTGTITMKLNENGAVTDVTGVSFTYTMNPNPDGSIAMTLNMGGNIDTPRFVLGDDGQMAVFDGTDAGRQRIMVIYKIDTAKTYGNADVSGEYYNLGYERNMTGVADPPANGNGSFMAISGVHNFKGNGLYDYSGKANSVKTDGTSLIWDDTGKTNQSYTVNPDGSFTGGNGAFLGWLTGNGLVFGGGGVFQNGVNNQVGYFFMKKGDKTYATSNLAGKWALVSFGDDTQAGQPQGFASGFGTMTCDAAGACQYSFRQRRQGSPDYSYDTGNVQIAVAADGSFGGSLPVGSGAAPPAYAGAIGNDGNSIMFNVSFDSSKVWNRQIFVGVRANSIGDLAGAPTISFTGFVEDKDGASVDQAVIQHAGVSALSTTSAGNGSFVLGNLLAGTPFHLKIYKGTDFTPTYSAQVSSTANIVNTRDRAFTLFPAGQLATWGVTDANKGIIRSRIQDKDGIFIGGVVVTATGVLQAGYPVCYDDACTSTQTSTYGVNGAAPGRYVVKNVLDGDTVTVTARKNGWAFNQRVFKTHAGGISQSRIEGLPVVVKGDVNGDGNVGLADMILALQMTVGMNPGAIRTDLATAGVDVNGDGKVMLEDLPFILQKTAGLRSSLETGKDITLVSYGHPPVGFNFTAGQLTQGFGFGDFVITGGDVNKAYGWLNGAQIADLGVVTGGIGAVTTAPESSQYVVPASMYIEAGRCYAFKLANGTYAVLQVKSINVTFGTVMVVTMVFDYKYQGNGTRNF